MKITTNNQYRRILLWSDLTGSERCLHSDNYDEVEQSSFFRFRDFVYDLNDFLQINEQWGEGILKDWDGCHNETFFSSVVVKYSECGEAVRVGLATC